jgi:hypothetical protein
MRGLGGGAPRLRRGTREWVEDEEMDAVAVDAAMNIDGELGSELAAMADAWLDRQGVKGT